jgi:hypothetical protein
MHTGKTYWAIQIDTWALQEKLPKDQYHPTRRKLQADLKTALNGLTEYKTEQTATEAFKRLPNDLQAASGIVELTPVFGIL